MIGGNNNNTGGVNNLNINNSKFMTSSPRPCAVSAIGRPVVPKNPTKYSLNDIDKMMPKQDDIVNNSTATSELKEAFLAANMEDDPCHIKPLPHRLDFDKLIGLPGSEETRSLVREARTYIESTEHYDNVPRRNPRDARMAIGLRPKHVAQLLDAGIIEFVDDESEVEGVVFVFLIHETVKRRYRIIQHTKDINENSLPAPQVVFTGIKRRCEHVHCGTHMLEMDLMAYYTHFLLDPAVRRLLVFRVPGDNGTRLVRLCVGPTGQSHMVYVAVSATRHILSFDKRSASSDDQIDNMLFVGSKEDVIADARTAFIRCSEVGVSINDVKSEDDIPPLAVREGDYCGLHLNLTDKTVSLTKKVTNKIELSWSIRSGWTWRGFAAHMGLLFYSMQVIDIPVFKFFNLLRFVSRVHEDMLGSHNALWDYPAVIPPSAMSDIDTWSALALSNKPRLVPKPMDPNVLICLDASRYGWGYVAHDLVSGAVFFHGEKWSPAFVKRFGKDRLRRSTFTEPWAVHFTKQHLLKRLPSDATSTRHFLIGTDSVTAAALHRKGYSARSFDLNAVATVDRSAFPELRCSYAHIEGAQNVIADALSRGNKLPLDETLGKMELIQWMKSSLQRLLGDHLPGGLTPSGVGSAAEVSITC